jgi:hypothetical protein
MNYENIRQSLTDKFDQLSVLLEEMQSRTRELKHEARAAWESQLAELERQRRDARSKLTDFSSTSAEAWETFKQSMEATWQSIKNGYEEIAKKFQG